MSKSILGLRAERCLVVLPAWRPLRLGFTRLLLLLHLLHLLLLLLSNPCQQGEHMDWNCGTDLKQFTHPLALDRVFRDEVIVSVRILHTERTQRLLDVVRFMLHFGRSYGET